MQTKPYDWFDQKKHKCVYGLQVKHLGRWMVVGVKGKPLLFETEEERDEERAKWRRVKNKPCTGVADCEGEG